MTKTMTNKYLVMTFAAMSICFTSCKKEFTLNESSVTLNQGDQYTIGYENGTNLVYTSDNPYVATVDNNGVVTANFVGNANINVAASEGNQILKVNVAPLYTLYEEPYLDFTMSKTEVMDMYGDTYLGQSVDGDLEMSFFQVNSKYAYAFLFTGDELEAIYAVCQYTGIDKVRQFLSERYSYIYEEDGMYTYTNWLDLGITTTTYKGDINFGYGCLVCYFPVDFSDMANSRSSAIVKNDWIKLFNTTISK